MDTKEAKIVIAKISFLVTLLAVCIFAQASGMVESHRETYDATVQTILSWKPGDPITLPE